MDINELQSFKLSDAVKFHDELNPNLWTKDGKLLPEVQEQLEKIAEDFVVSLGISDLKVKDITISGSNAAYSYTPHSDLDLHVLVDFNELPNDEVYKELFNAKKTVYNDTHDIKINNIPVELYVQDTNQKHTSLGEYSVKNKDWVKFPIKRRANLDQKETKLKYEKLGNLIELAITLKDLSRIGKVLDTLKRYRRAGLEKTGEFGPENLAYKLIRKQGLLQALIDTKNEVHSQNLSLPEDQLLEVTDTSEAIDLKKLVDDPKKLKTHDTHISPQEAYRRLLNGEKDKYLVLTVAKDAEFSYLYAKDVLKKRFPLGEPAIAKDEHYSFMYALDVLKKRFPLGEPTIAKDAVYSYWYARDVLDEPFPLGEPAIAKNVAGSYFYALQVLGKPFPLGEPVISTDAKKSYDYAIDVLYKPFPLGEPAIYNSSYRKDYEKYVLDGRPWTGLKKKKVKEAIDLKNLVSDPKKLKTSDTHISPEDAYERVANGEKDEYLIRAIAKSGEFSYLYAAEILKKRFPLGEPAIARSADYSCWYAADVLKGPFPLGEPAIAKDDMSSFLYARDILDEPFPLGEPAIAEHASFSCFYALQVLGKPFPLGEPAISTNAKMSYNYAIDVLYKPFPLGEPAIAKDAYCSYLYAKYVLKKPFPLGEPAIAKDAQYSGMYKKYVLDGRPWTGLKKKKVKESMDLKNLVDDPKKLSTYNTHISPKEAYERLKKGETDEYLLRVVAKYPKYACYYAIEILKGPFPLGEPAIAKSADFSYIYALNVLNGPFPMGEPAIAKDAEYSYKYAKDALKGPFPLGEPSIAKSVPYSCFYAADVLKKPWPLVEPAIAKDAEYSYVYARYVLEKPFPLGEPAIAKNMVFSYEYAEKVLKGPFPLGEPAMAKSDVYSYQYAKYVLGKPFPLGEPAIYKNSRLKSYYIQEVLKGRPWTGLDQKVDEAIDLKKLVTDPKKLKTHDTHIGPKEAYERLKNGETDEYLIHIVAKDTEYSYWYANSVLKKRFPLGEPAISKNDMYSCWYAVFVLKKPFPLGEPAIAKDAEYSYLYAADVLKNPFPLGEPAIYRSELREDYEKDVLKGRPWTGLKKKKVKESMDLKNLVDDPKKLSTYNTHISPKEAYERLKKGESDEYLIRVVAKDAEHSYLYAKYVLKGPFPLAEPAIAKSAYHSYFYAKDVLKGPFPLGEPAIAKYAMSSYYYARDALKGPFTLGEPAIAKDAGYSWSYAAVVLKKPWPLVEPDIAEDAKFSYLYAKDVLKGPFTLGEPAIAKDSWVAYEYAKYVLDAPFPLGEPAIYKDAFCRKEYKEDVLKGRPWTNIDQKIDEAIDLKNLVDDPKKLKTHDTHIGPKEAYERLKNGETDEYLIHIVAKDTEYSYWYANTVLKKRFPLGEPVIAKSARYSCLYATDVLKKRFPLGEPAIAKDAAYSYDYVAYVLKKPFPLGEPAIYNSGFKYIYETNVLKGRPWTGLDQKVTEALNLKNLVSDPEKLKTHDTHISPEEAYERLKKGEKDEYLIRAISKHAKYSYRYASKILKGPFPLGEPAIAKDIEYSYWYARDVLNGPFALGEPAIATDGWISTLYAEAVLKGPFPLAEPAIAKDALYSYRYAAYVLKKPFPLGEPAIAKDAKRSYHYARHVLKNTFPLGEPAIARSGRRIYYERDILKGRPWTGLDQKVDEAINLKKLVSEPKKLKTYDTHLNAVETVKYKIENGIAPTKEDLIKVYNETNKLQGTNSWLTQHSWRNQQDKILNFNDILKSGKFSYLFAKNILNGPFPLGEPAIAEDAKYSYRYANDVLKKIFPLGEPAIAKSAEYSFYYAGVLKGRFTLGEPAIAKNGWYSYLYAKEVLKKPFSLGEPAIYKSKWKTDYEIHVLKGKPWTGLDQPVTETNIDESASGYIPSKKEANDPRYSTALTVDIKPDTMQQNAKKLGWKISRRGTPPLLFKPKA